MYVSTVPDSLLFFSQIVINLLQILYCLFVHNMDKDEYFEKLER